MSLIGHNDYYGCGLGLAAPQVSCGPSYNGSLYIVGVNGPLSDHVTNCLKQYKNQRCVVKVASERDDMLLCDLIVNSVSLKAEVTALLPGTLSLN